MTTADTATFEPGGLRLKSKLHITRDGTSLLRNAARLLPGEPGDSGTELAPTTQPPLIAGGDSNAGRLQPGEPGDSGTELAATTSTACEAGGDSNDAVLPGELPGASQGLS